MAANIKAILSAMNERPILIYPAYIAITGDHAAAAALGQIIYWHGVKGGQFFKTDAELAEEIRVSEKQMKRIKTILKSIPFLSIELKQVPAKTFYDIDYDILADVLANNYTGEGQTSLSQKGQTEWSQKGQTEWSQKGQTEWSQKGQTITENTNRDYITEITSEKNIAPSLSASELMPCKNENEDVFLLFPLNKAGEFYAVKNDYIAEMSSLYPAVNVEQELRSMRAWLINNPSKRKTKSGITSFINRWLSKAQNDGQQKSPETVRSGQGLRVSEMNEEQLRQNYFRGQAAREEAIFSNDY